MNRKPKKIEVAGVEKESENLGSAAACHPRKKLSFLMEYCFLLTSALGESIPAGINGLPSIEKRYS